MALRRIARLTAAGAGGLLGGLAAGIVAALALIVLVIWLVADSPTDQVVKGVRELIPRHSAVHVAGCRQISHQDEEREFRCTLQTERCKRSYLFAVSTVATVTIVQLETAPERALAHPCRYPSDH